jgi:transposase InsO family protein
VLSLLNEAVAQGIPEEKACNTLFNLSLRTIRRWQGDNEKQGDKRRGPKKKPKNALSLAERKQFLKVTNSHEYRDLSPNQIVPRLADRGTYLGSERTLYRVLAEAGQLTHRQKSKIPVGTKPIPLVATGPGQVCSWDISYLKLEVRGLFVYLYLMVDIWSRKIVNWQVHDRESSELAAFFVEEACEKLGLEKGKLFLHQDNGTSMRGVEFKQKLVELGVEPSYSRPGVSDDNPFSESLFRHLKYCPEYPGRFKNIEEARVWVEQFVTWYNEEHQHSAIKFVTPNQRHNGQEAEILARRMEVYEKAHKKHPERWSGSIRNWNPIKEVYLNPDTNVDKKDVRLMA